MSKRKYIQVEKIRKKERPAMTDEQKRERIEKLARKMKIKIGDDK